jgi:hypothetical protein
LEAALRWLADATPGSAELLRLMDATPVPCGQSVFTARRSGLAGWAGYGYCPSHSRWYWGSKLLLIVTCDGTVTIVVIDAVTAAVQDELAAVHLDRARVVGGVTVDHVDYAVDQPAGEPNRHRGPRRSPPSPRAGARPPFPARRTGTPPGTRKTAEDE